MPTQGSAATGAHDGRRAGRALTAIAQPAVPGGPQATTVLVAHGPSQPPGTCVLASPPFLPLRLILLRTPALPGRPAAGGDLRAAGTAINTLATAQACG